MGSQRRSSSSPKPQAGPKSSSTSSSRRRRPTPPGAPRTLGPAPRQAMARAGGSSGGGGGGCSSRHPQFARGSRCSQLRGRECDKAPRATRVQRSALQQLRATVWDLRRPGARPRDRLRGSWLRAASLGPSAGRVGSGSPRSPPAPSAAPLSLPEPSRALEVRWAVAGLDGQRASPMAGRCGQRGAGPLCRWRARPRPPAALPAPPPSLPRAPRPASRLSLSSHPFRRVQGLGRDGVESLRPGQPAPSSPR